MSIQPSWEIKNLRRKEANEALDKFPDVETRTIARYLFHNHPLLFLSINSARSTINYLRGTDGKAARIQLKDKKYVRQSL